MSGLYDIDEKGENDIRGSRGNIEVVQISKQEINEATKKFKKQKGLSKYRGTVLRKWLQKLLNNIIITTRLLRNNNKNNINIATKQQDVKKSRTI